MLGARICLLCAPFVAPLAACTILAPPDDELLARDAQAKDASVADCVPAPSTPSREFDEVSYSLSGPFLEFFDQVAGEQQAGLQVLGLPIEEPRCRSIEVGGQLERIWTQYTQRARLEYHAGGTVRLGRLGAELQSAAWTQNSGSKPGCSFVGPSDEQGNYVCTPILDHFEQFGIKAPVTLDQSILLWGYPISEVVNVNTHESQWFERARLEIHVDPNGAEYVLGGLLGCARSQINGPGCP